MMNCGYEAPSNYCCPEKWRTKIHLKGLFVAQELLDVTSQILGSMFFSRDDL